MTDKVYLTWEQCQRRATNIVQRHKDQSKESNLAIFGVPRGGHVPAALVLAASRTIYPSNLSKIVSRPQDANLIVDDIVDSGATAVKYRKELPNTRFRALIDKQELSDPTAWVVFPWETENELNGPADNIVRILQFIGEDPEREGLIDTPKRVLKAYEELFSGYKQKPEDYLTTFEDGTCDEMVVVKNVEFMSFCEHHMLPFNGVAHIGYIPDGRIIGLSKLARLLEVYARRLQVQERLTQQVTQALDEHLHPKGAACVIEARHHCMGCRGVKKPTASMVSSSLTGAFKTKPEARAEFFSIIQ